MASLGHSVLRESCAGSSTGHGWIIQFVCKKCVFLLFLPVPVTILLRTNGIHSRCNEVNILWDHISFNFCRNYPMRIEKVMVWNIFFIIARLKTVAIAWCFIVFIYISTYCPMHSFILLAFCMYRWVPPCHLYGAWIYSVHHANCILIFFKQPVSMTKTSFNKNLISFKA